MHTMQHCYCFAANMSKPTTMLALSILAACGHHWCQTGSASHRNMNCIYHETECTGRPPHRLYGRTTASQTSTIPGVPADEEAAAPPAAGLASRGLPAKTARRSDSSASLRASSLF